MAKSTLLIKTIELIKKNPGMSIKDLARELERSERTIYRWLGELATELGTPIYCSDGGYYLNELGTGDRLDLNAEEILALRLSLKSSPFNSTSPIGKHAESGWKKIRNSVSYDGLVSAKDMTATHAVQVNAPWFLIDHDILNALEHGLNERHRLRVLYSSLKSNALKEYLIDPYAMVFKRHSWYMVAYSHEHENIRQFKLQRFRHVEDTGESFEIPENFSIDEYFRLSWEVWAGGEPTYVKVRFSSEVAPIITESRRHPTQTVYPQPDGSVIFEACVSGIEEIAIWIMGYGKDAQVLEPPSLIEHIHDHAKAMVALYEKKDEYIELR